MGSRSEETQYKESWQGWPPEFSQSVDQLIANSLAWTPPSCLTPPSLEADSSSQATPPPPPTNLHQPITPRWPGNGGRASSSLPATEAFVSALDFSAEANPLHGQTVTKREQEETQGNPFIINVSPPNPRKAWLLRHASGDGAISGGSELQRRSRHQCPHCYKSYADAKGLRNHINIIHLHQRPLCVACGKDFGCRTSLVRHSKQCSGPPLPSLTANANATATAQPRLQPRSYPTCEDCGNSYATPYFLLRHRGGRCKAMKPAYS